MSRRLALALVLGLCAAPAGATLRTVTNSDDAGAGSLRAAIAAATAGDIIDFAIPGAGVHTISLATALGPVAAGVTIDATTQGVANCASWPPTLTVEIEGGSTSTGTDGITIGGDTVVVRGLVINSFPRDGIHFLNGAGAATIECNFIGTDVTGLQDYGNANVGIALDDSSGTLIDGNLISANAIAGVDIDAASSTVALQGNYIGTDVTGAAALGNFTGVTLLGSDNTIGGVALGNVISGNVESGISIEGVAATGNFVYGNTIGSNAAGDASLPNGGPGVFIVDGASQNTVGSTTAGAGNLLRANGASGVWVSSDTSIDNAVRGNSTLLNGSIGIELGDFFAEPNDPGDPDSGANRLQNTPELVDVVVAGDQVTAAFSISTNPANATYPLLVDFYIADADAEEGESYVGTSTYSATDFATGEVSKVFTAAAPLAPGNEVVATATDSAGNTSEFTDIAITVVPEPGVFACELAAFAAIAIRRRRESMSIPPADPFTVASRRACHSSEARAPTSTDAT
jgi:hypothetical protein